jgi:DNA-binding NtrC family response regulator
VRRIGAPRAIPIDTRIVAATNRVPEDEVAAGRFRADLLWRLDVVRIHLPPLRERLADIDPLVEHFLGLLAPGRGARLGAGELERLAEYHWPGNVRELRNVLERSLLVDRGDVLHPSHLLAGPGRVAAPPPPGMAAPPRSTPTGVTRTLAEVERDHALAVWEAQGRHAETAATALGISVATLRRRLKEWDVQ